MNRRKIPASVIVIAVMYLAVGVVGYVAHFKDFRAQDGVWVELTEFLAVVCGVFMLRGENWARWLAVAWIAFHVALSAFGQLRELAVSRSNLHCDRVAAVPFGRHALVSGASGRRRLGADSEEPGHLTSSGGSLLCSRNARAGFFAMRSRFHNCTEDSAAADHDIS